MNMEMMLKKTKRFVSKTWNSISLSIYALLASMVVGSIFLLIGGNNPLIAYKAVWEASFSKPSYFYYTLGLATPLIFTGLAFLLGRKVGLITLGMEGQLYLGALAGVYVAAYMQLPNWMYIPVSLLASIIGGVILGWLPAWLYVKFKSNVVISTLMINYVAINFVGYIVQTYLQAPNSYVIRTEKVNEAAFLPLLVDKTILTIGFIVAVVIAVLIHYLLKKTVLGYEIRAVGLNEAAAETAGIKYKRIILITMMLSGSIAAIAGWSHVMGVEHRLIMGFSPGYGWDGVSVAALSGGNPIAVVVSGFIIGAFKNGSMYISRTTDIPMDFVYVIQAFVILFVASPRLIGSIINTIKKAVNFVWKKIVKLIGGGINHAN